MSDRDDGRLAGNGVRHEWGGRLDVEEPLTNRSKIEEDWQNGSTGDAGSVTREDYWERITLLLEKIIPTAKGNDVRMASHPSNPRGLPFGYGYINAPIQAVNSEP